MGTGAIYLWGCVGGFVAAMFVYAMPPVVLVAMTGDQHNRQRAVATAMLVGFLTVVAGLVSLIPDQVTRGQATSLGLASQAVIKGLISGALDALPPRPAI